MMSKKRLRPITGMGVPNLGSKRSLRGRNVMITGGAGFIGSHLCDRVMMDRPSKLVIVDNFSLGKMRNIKSLRNRADVKVYRQNARRQKGLEKALEDEQISVIFNMAVIPLPMSLDRPMETVLTNVAITANICELLRRGKFDTLVHCSSSEAYGTALYVPMDEEHPEKPHTPYAASKIALIEKIAKIMGYEGEIVHKPPRPGDVLRHKGDISLAKKLFNYVPRTSFDEGLKKTIDWYSREFKSSRTS